MLSFLRTTFCTVVSFFLYIMSLITYFYNFFYNIDVYCAFQVFVVETNPLCKRLTEGLIYENNLQDKIRIIHKHPEEVEEKDLLGKKVLNFTIELIVSLIFFHHIALGLFLFDPVQRS